MGVKKIIVVGAGPAGMMAAIRAGALGQNVTLIDKNPYLGKKLLLSGKGRCNLTNACPLEGFLNRFSKNSAFLRDAFKLFFNTDLIKFFEDRGLKLKIERQMRVFPVTDKSGSILEVLKKELNKEKVRVICKAALKNILVANSKIEAIELADNAVITSDRIILATGGVSYGFTGSTGEGLEIAKGLGHRIVTPRAGLVPLEVKERFIVSLEGITLKNVRLKFKKGEKNIISDVGELLFTGFGVSGPLVLTLSGRITDWLLEGGAVYLEIDLKPALSFEQLDVRLLREFNAAPRKNIKNLLKDFLPQRMVNVFAEISGISLDKSTSQITKEERRNLVLLFKGLCLTILGPRPIKEAMITRGGVCLKDIDPRTMQSRLIKGLYFAGEIMDIDADTGGFNLQAAFSTGYLAGQSAALN
ncbi:MAG: NAD(P)/FAD-dependent oxidoreductase [Candidatus Omnitrophota bacterium]|nr:NAD(P)/FAD-dependent oxidoreductase [Candidatus Omnitrophota bacterium]